MKQEKAIFSRFAVVGVFVAVVLVGLGYGLLIIVLDANLTEPKQSAVLQVPTVIEYRAEAGTVMAPFLGQIETLQMGAITEDAGEAIADLAGRTQDRLLRMRVPSSERDAHLSFVILLDQWKRAVNVEGDISGVLRRTNELVEKYRWISPEDKL